MAIKDLIRWNDKGRDVGFQRATEVHPFLAFAPRNESHVRRRISRVRSCTVRAWLPYLG